MNWNYIQNFYHNFLLTINCDLFWWVLKIFNDRIEYICWDFYNWQLPRIMSRELTRRIYLCLFTWYEQFAGRSQSTIPLSQRTFSNIVPLFETFLYITFFLSLVSAVFGSLPQLKNGFLETCIEFCRYEEICSYDHLVPIFP